VIAGTIGVVGAVILHDHYRDRSRTRIHVRDSDRVYRPGERFQRLPSLNKGERGRLGNNAPLAARGRTPVLQVKSDAQTKGQRQFPSRPAGMPQSNPQLQQSKQISPNSQRPPNAMQPKSIPTTPADNNRGRQFDGSRQNFDRRDFEQKKLEQRGDQKNMLPQSSQNLQRQNNQPQFPRNSGPGNMPPVQQNNAPRQNFRPPQQNYQPPNVQRPPQHNPAPHVQQQSRPQPQPSRPAPKPNQEKKN
jgi:hypothetical protein